MKQFFNLVFIALSIIVKAQSADNKPFVLGEVRTIESVHLAEKRILNIYLPDGYQGNDTSKYDVIYLLDGSSYEDFIHIVGIVQFCNYPWVNMCPKSIVVGIENVDRRRDFTFPTTIEKDKKAYPTTGSSEKFIAFIEQEVQPFVAKNYKINQNKTIIGQSLGGLLATEILYKKPLLFNKYIIISPSLWWNNESLLAQKAAVFEPDFTQKTAIYVGVGKEGHIMERDAKELAKKLKKSKKNNLKVDFEYFAKENHANILHQAVYNAFNTLYPQPKEKTKK